MANSYATDLELMDRLGMDVGDSRRDVLSDVLEAASRWIDQATGHRFYAVSETRYYTLCYPFHNGGTRIEVDDMLALTSLQTDNNGDGVFETTWTVDTDYWLSPRNAPVNGEPYNTINRTSLTGRFYFPAYEESVKVTGSFGYSTLATRPSNIRELCLAVAMQMAEAALGSSLARSTSDLAIPGVQSYSIGNDLSVTMQKTADVVTVSDLPFAARSILNLYTKPSFVV